MEVYPKRHRRLHPIQEEKPSEDGLFLLNIFHADGERDIREGGGGIGIESEGSMNRDRWIQSARS